MATSSNTSKVENEPLVDRDPDKTKDGRPIFKTRHYNKIPVQERGAIRILKIHPGAPGQSEVQCELIPGTILSDESRLPHETSDVQFKPYDALSWCWGKTASDSWIRFLKDETSYVKYVQPGLVAALRALRHGTYARYLWVDAVCINQDYKAEKNFQVEMMAEIYGRADCVRIWLGDSDPSSDLAILFIKQRILQLQHFDDLSSSPDTNEQWKALLELMQRDWFSRRWVIQEVTLAKKAIIHCGKAKLAWNKFAVAVELFVEVETATHRLSEVMKTDAKYHHVPRWFEYISQLGASLLVDATGKLFRDYDYIQQNIPPTKKSRKKPAAPRKPEDELCYESEDDEVMSPQERANRYKHDQETQHAKSKGQPLLTLEYLVSNMSIFNVTNPHDTVYALLAIAKDTTPTAVNKKLHAADQAKAILEMFTVKKEYPVNYQASYIDICREFIEFCVRQNVKNDPSRALDVLCRPWAIEIDDKDNESTLPSWLPRQSKASYGMVLGPGIDGMRMGRTNADSLVGLPNLTNRNYNAAETKGLNRKIFRFRKRVTKPSTPTNSLKPLVQVQNGGAGTSSETANLSAQANEAPKTSALPANVELNEAVASAHANGLTANALQEEGVATPQSSESPLNHFSLYVEGFVLDTVHSVQPSSQSGSIPTAWARFARWESMDGTPPEHFWRTLVADRGSDGKNPPVYYSRACQESFRKGGTTQGVVDTMGLIEHERNSVVAQFCRRVQAAIWNRALFETKAGRFGLVANNVKEKDLICILYGCSVPVALRRHGPKKQSVMDDEMESEIHHIADYVVKSYRKHLARREIFRDQREKDKAEYRKWELAKREEWKKDDKWREQWQLVRTGLVRIHEFRAWVMKKFVILLEIKGDVKAADEAICVLHNCVNLLLLHIHEIAVWAGKLEDQHGDIIDQLRRSNEKLNHEPFKLTADQIALWNQFALDTDWSKEWSAENNRYIEEEGFKTWSRVYKYKIGYDTDRKDSMEKWKQQSAQKWTQEWATENSWFLCIDPFRAWLREKGKFYGTEEALDSKQEWEKDDEWHRKRDKDELEITSFNAWMDAKGRKNPELDIAQADEEIAQFDEWRPIWRSENRDADMRAERKAWDEEWEKRKTDSEKRRHASEIKKRKEKAEKRDKEPFLERWRKGWRPPTINWQEFEIAVSYGKRWLKVVRRRKRDHVNAQEEWWKTAHALKQRQQARASYLRKLGKLYEYRASTVDEANADGNNPGKVNQTSKGTGLAHANYAPETTQNSLSLGQPASTQENLIDLANGNPEPAGEPVSELEVVPYTATENAQDNMTEVGAETDTKGVDDNWKLLAMAEKSDANSSTSETSLRGREDSEHTEDLLNGEPTTLHPHGGESLPNLALKRSKTHPEKREEDEKRAWNKEHQSLLKATFKSRDDLKDWIERKKTDFRLHWDKTTERIDEQYKEWKKSTPKFLAKDGEFHYDRGRPKPVKEPAELLSNPRGRDERQIEIAAGRAKCLHPKGHYFESKQRAKLTKNEQVGYMSKVNEKFRSLLGDDGQWYYEMLGECYVHGMMDGEAMAHQNNNGIPYFANMTPDNISARRKGRIGHSKSKNGCLTCKFRRVKCGEEKPQCDRCTSTGRRCEYKIAMGHDFRSWSHGSSSQSSPLLVMGSRSPESLDSIELRAFEYFFARGMPIFPGATNSRFWKTCILQACHEEPVIWDAVIALSALFEHPQYSDEPIGMRGGPHYSLTAPVKDQTHQQALTWYNRSLSKLRTSVERGMASNAVALISCILYICIELLQDNVTEVLQLYHRGVGIISNCSAPLLEECIAPLFYHFSAIAIVTDYISPESAVKPVSEAPDHFSSLEEAEIVLYRFLAQIMTQIRASAKVILAGGHIEEHRIAKLEAQNNVLRNVLDQWMWSFQALGITLEGDASYAEKFTVAKLLLAHATLRVALVTSTSRSAMVNDDLIDDFEDILYYARYGIMATRYADGTQTPFSLETSFALSLYICATQCRDYRIRHEALDLLPEAPKVQGLCKSVPHVVMATKVVRIEEAGLELQDRGDGTGPEMFIPESHRICNVSFTPTRNENGEHVWALKYNRSLPDGAGGYRIVEELSLFDSSDD